MLPNDSFEDLSSLTNEKSIILIPDSNSLNNGTLLWLLRSLKGAAWILPFVISLTQIQERDARLKDMSIKKMNPKNAKEALRSRGKIFASMSLLQRYRTQYQVLELEPSLLRYLRQTGASDEGNVLEDRLLLEGVHAVLRSTRTRAQQRVVTSDVLLARMLETEGIKCLYVPSPTLPDTSIDCITFNTFSGSFSGASLRSVLWDLAHVFSKVRLERDGARRFDLSSYWPGKTPEDWRLERLDVGVPELVSVGSAPTPAEEKEEALGESDQNASGALSDAFLPQASLPLVLKLVGATLVGGPLRLSDLIVRLAEPERPTPGSARRALEIARRIGLVTYARGFVAATADAQHADKLLQENNLDELAGMLMRFEPYRILTDELARRRMMERSKAESILKAHAGSDPAKEASSRLTRYPILLGQAWTHENQVADGANRPGDHAFADGFAQAFERHSRDGLAKVSDMLPDLCTTLQMSPWAVGRQLERVIASSDLSDYSFQPAAGGKPIVKDRVIGGRFDQMVEVPVPVDRFELGGRPIFTVGVVR